MNINFVNSIKKGIEATVKGVWLGETLGEEILARAAANSTFKGEVGETLYINSERILLAGLGKRGGEVQARKIGGAIGKALSTLDVADIAVDIDIPRPELIQLAYALALKMYRFDKYITLERKRAASLTFITSDPLAAASESKDMRLLVEAVEVARDLASEPSNILTPSEFARRIKEAESLGAEVEILEAAELKKLGMNLVLAVGSGSVNPPCVAVITYKGKPEVRAFDLALVGKGVCFDSGGIDLKPREGMNLMKGDMSGGAAVFATIRMLAKQKTTANVAGVIGLVENMPDGGAYKAGDILTSMSGKTVEILDTDAEGRLVLADCATYAVRKFKPAAVVDIATLTGAICIALGEHYAGLFSNDEKLASALVAASAVSGERVWRMPAGEEYARLNKSKIADVCNLPNHGGSYARDGGASSGAEFVRFFVGDVPWAHLDIGGAAESDGEGDTAPAGFTGFGVALIYEYLKNALHF
ncbi:MAG: leucyl aminopeptidase [Rickettsiales bacterium]|jgi:leucyl aminopeptidase|nr:leucyl aminopeptidase [Rickettsiales bacterium]